MYFISFGLFIYLSKKINQTLKYEIKKCEFLLKEQHCQENYFGLYLYLFIILI